MKMFNVNNWVFIIPSGIKCQIIDSKLDEKTKQYKYLCEMKFLNKSVKQWLDETLLTKNPIKIFDMMYLTEHLTNYPTTQNRMKINIEAHLTEQVKKNKE